MGPPKGWLDRWASSRNGPKFVMVAGSIVPSVVFVSMVILATFALPFFVYPAAFFVLILITILVWPLPPAGVDHHGVGLEMHPRNKWEWWPVAALFGAVVLGFLAGSVNYNQFMLPYLHYKVNRQYTNLLPSEEPGGYSDAGAIYFSKDARLDTAKSAGYQDWHTYCVAPVVGSNPSDPVGFWAAGMNCCDSRHNFKCGQATDLTAQAGIRISESDPAGKHLPQFKKAVAMAAETYGFEASEDPVMVYWVKDPKAYGHMMFWFSVVYLGVMTLVAFIASFLMIKLLTAKHQF